MSNRVGVLGKTGRLGRAVIDQLTKAGYNVTPLGREEIELRDPTLLVGVKLFDFVINCAAMNGIEACDKDIGLAWAVNATGPRYLAETCRDYDIPFLHFSTDYVIDRSAGADEGDPVNPKTVYAATKLAGEIGVLHYDQSVFRVSSIYGVDKAGVLDCLNQADRGRGSKADPIQVLDQVTTPTSVYAVAVAVQKYLDILWSEGPLNVAGLYHCCDRAPMRKSAFAKHVLNAVFPDMEYHIKENRLPGRPDYSVMSPRKLERLGILMPSVQDDLKSTLSIMGLI